MRILTVLTYYRPHTSGLTIYAERIANAFVKRGHQVTVLTSQYDKELPRREKAEGIQIIRMPVWFRVNKGVVIPTFGLYATREVLRHDVVLLHLPQFDAAGVSLRGRLLGIPTVIVYHSDLLLPPGIFNRFVNTIVDVANHLTAQFTHRITAYTDDFANHSPYLSRYAHKCVTITPPVELPKADPNTISAFHCKYNPNDWRVIGMATRFATEKGVEILLDALPKVLQRYPNTKVLYAGQFEGVWGEAEYFNRLYPRIQQLENQGRWKFLGVLPLSEMASFYPNLDVIVVPSLNSTETFGFVQIEAMMNGVPAVASDLPGVRQPVGLTGMGKIIPVGDSIALADAIIEVLENSERFGGDTERIIQKFNPEGTAARYEELFEQLHKSRLK